MFLFRKTAEPAEDHEPVDLTNHSHEEQNEVEEHDEEGESVHDDEQHEYAEENESDGAEDGEAAQQVEEEEADKFRHIHDDDDDDDEGGAYDAAEDGPQTAREGTVPPLEERHIVQQQQRDVEDEEAAEAHAAAPSHSAPVPALTMPRTYAGTTNNGNMNGNGGRMGSPYSTTNTNNVMRRGSRGTTPRATGLSPRSHSRAGHSYAGSALSAEEAAVVEQQYRRCSSVVQSARNISDRRASSVNHLVGNIDGGSTLARRRSGSMTAAEREAVERMMDNEFHRQEAAERSAQFSRIRETTLVETKLQKEKATYDKLVQQERERHAEIGRRSSLREQRMTAAAQRRNEIDAQRQQAILQSVDEKDTRYTMRDPYTVVAAQRRYRSPIAPSRRASSPAFRNDSRRASGPFNGGSGSRTHSPSADARRYSAPESTLSARKPGIDMSPPKQCLPMNAWKTPEQLKRKERAGSNPHRCLPPGAWEAPTVADHPRQWH